MYEYIHIRTSVYVNVLVYTDAKVMDMLCKTLLKAIMHRQVAHAHTHRGECKYRRMAEES
jgi:hypothetical protein